MPAGQPHYGFQIQEGAIEVITPQGSVTLDEPGEGTFLPLAGGRPRGARPCLIIHLAPADTASASAYPARRSSVGFTPNCRWKARARASELA